MDIGKPKKSQIINHHILNIPIPHLTLLTLVIIIIHLNIINKPIIQVYIKSRLKTRN